MLAATEPQVTHNKAAVLDEVFRAHYSRVLKAAYRVTGSMSDAEDVLQTVFLRLARRDLATEGVVNLESYMYRAAVNAALDLLRARQEARTVALDDAQASVEAVATGSWADPGRMQDSVEVRAWLRAALARLSPRAAEMFALRYLEDYGNREIARMLNTSQAVVAVTLHRTRHQLQKDFRAFMRGKR